TEASLDRGLVVAEYVIDDANSRRPVLPAAHALDLVAVERGRRARRCKSARGSTHAFDRRRQILEADSARDRQALELPWIRRENPEVLIQIGELVVRRIQREEAGWNAVVEGHVTVAVLVDADMIRSKTVLDAHADRVRAGDVGGCAHEVVSRCLEVLVAARRE